MFHSFFDHHQVLKELKYAICNRVVIVRNGIPLGFTLSSTMTLKYDVKYLNTLPPDSCEHCPHPVDRPFKLSTLQLRSTIRVPLNEHNYSQYKHI